MSSHARFQWTPLQQILTAGGESLNYLPFTLHRIYLSQNGDFPNNENFPLLLYKGVWKKNIREAEDTLAKNEWTSPWHWGV